MCRHIFRDIGGVRACLKCGLTIDRCGHVIFDRKLPHVIARKGEKSDDRYTRIPGLSGDDRGDRQGRHNG